MSRPDDGTSEAAGLGEEKGEILKLAEDFIKVEKEGIREYKKLKSGQQEVPAGFFVVLIQAMMRDSEKHVEISDYLRQRLKEA